MTLVRSFSSSSPDRETFIFRVVKWWQGTSPNYIDAKYILCPKLSSEYFWAKVNLFRILKLLEFFLRTDYGHIAFTECNVSCMSTDRVVWPYRTELQTVTFICSARSLQSLYILIMVRLQQGDTKHWYELEAQQGTFNSRLFISLGKCCVDRQGSDLNCIRESEILASTFKYATTDPGLICSISSGSHHGIFLNYFSRVMNCFFFLVTGNAYQTAVILFP